MYNRDEGLGLSAHIVEDKKNYWMMEREPVLEFYIKKRIRKGSETWGYVVIEYDACDPIILNKEIINDLAYIGEVSNAEFNATTGSLSGINGEDLRKLTSIDIKEAVGNMADGLTVFSDNHIRYIDYVRKCRISNKKLNLKCKLLKDGGVMLVEVADKESRGSIVIPDYITKVRIINCWWEESKYKSPFDSCRYSRIKIEGEENRRVDLRAMFSGMRSEKIKLESRCSIVGLRDTFGNCSEVKAIDLNGLNTKELRNMSRIFYGCKNIKHVDTTGVDTRNVVDISQAFTSCDELKEVRMGNVNISDSMNAVGIFYDCTNLERVSIPNLNPSVYITKEGPIDINDISITEMNRLMENGYIEDSSSKEAKYMDNMRGKGALGIIKEAFRFKR